VLVEREIPLPADVKTPVMERVAGRLAREAERTVNIDGVKAFYADGWLLIRPSGTEPTCQVSAESPTQAGAEALVSSGTTLVHDLVAALSTGVPADELWCDPA